MSRPSRRTRSCLGALALVAAGAGLAPAQIDESVVVYGTRQGKNEIWEIDLTTGAATLATDKIIDDMFACGRHPHTGEVWIQDNFAENKMYGWDPATDVVREIHPGEFLQYHRFAFDHFGIPWGVPLNTKTLYRLDPITGAATEIGRMDNVGKGDGSGDMAFAPGDAQGFYYTIYGSFYYVPFSTLDAQYIGDVGFSCAGLAFQPDGTLYGTDRLNLFTIDLDTGASTLVGAFGTPLITDLSSGSLPLALVADAATYADGDVATLTTTLGTPNGLVGLAVDNIDGVPFFGFLFFDRFDAAGIWTLQTNIPPGLAGIEVGLRSFGFIPSGELIRTAKLNLVFN